MSLNIPPMQTVEKLARERHIARRLLDGPAEDRVRVLAQFHGESMRAVTKAYQHVTGETVTEARRRHGLVVPERRQKRRVRAIAFWRTRGRDVVGQMFLFDWLEFPAK